MHASDGINLCQYPLNVMNVLKIRSRDSSLSLKHSLSVPSTPVIP